MRTLTITAAALALAACATQESAPTKTAPVAAEVAATQAPQCWSGDHGKFFKVGDRTSLSGVDVVCEKTSDGKSGQWMGRKH